MPEIQEYLPQVAVPEGVGGVSPNTELSSSVGRGLEAFGRDVSDTFTQIHSQNVAQSKADTFSYFSNLRADQTSQLQQQIQDGSLNTEKFLENYDNQTTDFGGNVETPEGRRFFERLQARTRGELLKNANFGMAQVSANRVKGQWQDGINKLSLTLENDPLQFGDVVSQGHEAVDEMIQAGGLPEKLRDKATQEMTSKFAESALIGHAQINPEDAMKMVHEDALGGYLTPEQRQKMVGIIHSYARDQKVEDERTTRAVEKEKKETQENWYQQNFDKITSGALSVKDVQAAVRNGVIKPEFGAETINRIDSFNKREDRTDYHAKNQIFQRILDPSRPDHINDIEDLQAAVKGKHLSPSDYSSLYGALAKSPEDKALQNSERQLFSSASSLIRFKNPFTQQYDVVGEQKLATFKSDYIQAKKDIKAKGGDVADLTDPNSPSYFGNKFKSYMLTDSERMNHIAQDRTDKANGTRPSGDNPEAKPTNPNAKAPGESIQDWKKRTGYKGGA